ncbi:unnamed protein product [Sympodiomycopsis kandeliae]
MKAPLVALLTALVVAISNVPAAFSAPGLSPEVRAELQGLDAQQKRDMYEGLIITRAVNEELLSRGNTALTEEQARLVWEHHVISKRSNPRDSYSPTQIQDCPAPPSNPPGGGVQYVRDASSQQLGADEADYINRHRQAKKDDWSQWLSSASPGPNLNIPGGVDNYTNTESNLPRVGIAVSGGGYRAMLFGASVLQGWDARNQTANDRGTGGILQRADYLSGLSGGSWITGSLAINNWPTSQQLNDQVFNLQSNLVIPSDGKISFYASLVEDVKAKRDEWELTSITDYWGRALSHHLLNDTVYPDEGVATTWSDVVNVTNFKNAAYPYPIIVADQREPGQVLIYDNTTIWEFGPYETGSWGQIKAMFPTKLIGSTVNNGTISKCVLGWDNFGWVVGTSATLFNGLFTSLISSDGDSLIKDALLKITGAVASQDNDISQVPNPFYNFRKPEETDNISAVQNVSLVDGGEDNANVPLEPLLQPARKLDFILALDSSADTTSWPNGSSLYHQHIRSSQSGEQFSYVPVPYFPTTETFVNRGLNTRPVFFGCDASNATNAKTAIDGALAPIVAYIPNYPYTGLSNFSTFKLEYSAQESQLMLDNGVEVATLGGKNSTWAQCLACGMLERSWQRSGVQRPQECTECLNTYCWDGVEDTSKPKNPYSPPVGPPTWLEDTTKQEEAPYTGGDGSSSSMNTDAAFGHPVAHRGILAMVALVAVVLSMTV